MSGEKLGIGQMLREFHEVMRDERPAVPTWLSPCAMALRHNLLFEELGEMLEAEDAGDMVAWADALGDMIYVLAGSAEVAGFDIDPVLREIHRSNLSKRGLDGTIRKRSDGKILKPASFQPADILGVLVKQGWSPAHREAQAVAS